MLGNAGSLKAHKWKHQTQSKAQSKGQWCNGVKSLSGEIFYLTFLCIWHRLQTFIMILLSRSVMVKSYNTL